MDNFELNLMAPWAIVECLPSFAFDDSNFYGSRPVSTRKWFSPGEAPRAQAENKIGHAKSGTMEHPVTTLGEWDGVTMAGAGDSQEVHSEGGSDVLDEKWEATPPCFAFWDGLKSA
jgi:hypothetical protein